jgi:hypothetical protein
VDSRNPTEIDRPVMIYRGRPEARQEGGRIDGGRADLVQAEITGRGGGASMDADPAATTATRAASSRSVGVPRTILTRCSSFIDRAYDESGRFR